MQFAALSCCAAASSLTITWNLAQAFKPDQHQFFMIQPRVLNATKFLVYDCHMFVLQTS